MPDTVVGIDLGTTFSAVAYLGASGAELIPNALGETLTPSVVGIDESGRLLVGAAARELRVTRPERTASLFKRYMGSDWTTVLAGTKFTPEELSSRVLSSLKADAEAHLRRPVEAAVITVPAYFNDRQRNSTIAAGRIAGLRVDRIINEPTAAALAYGFHESGESKTLLVFDLGGGTFDVSIVDLFEGTIEVRSSAGESQLGGEDFTRAMAARLLERVGLVYEQAEHGSPKLVSRLLQQCELAKRKLARVTTVVVQIPDRNGELTEGGAGHTISRAEFDSWTSHLLARVDGPVRRALGDAKLTRSDIQEVILVGGATRMPAVFQRVAEILGQPPHRRLNPDEVVALGAAVQAGLCARAEAVNDLVVTDVAPFTLGVEITKTFGREMRDGYFQPILDRNTTLPASRVSRFGTMHANQTQITINIYQGESRRTQDNLFIGSFDVKNIPRGPVGQSVDIRFTYDLNGVLEVDATVVATQATTTHVVTRYAQGLTPDQIAAAVAAMAKLKTHPRDEQVHRYLIRRAERVFVELDAVGRDNLTALLDAFEAALSQQDPTAISMHSDALLEFLNYHDPHAGEDDDVA
ncbi:MAG: Hsp70 family protein [Gemmataceae bacterium]|nr:Hsp70 family protein [Gemmataceae bacterium]